MPSKRTGIALPPLQSPDFIKYILGRHQAPTTLLICSTKEDFLKDFLSSSHNSQSVSESERDEDGQTPDSLLIPTIDLIARSSTVKLAFVPTLPHLRAYLASYRPSSKSPNQVVGTSGHRVPLLGVWGLACLHRSTAEHSAQGFSRSLSLAIEAASYGDQKLVLGEPPMVHDAGELDDADASNVTSEDPWKEKLPLLNGSIRFGGDDRILAGKTVEVEKVVAKWCRFVKLDPASDIT
ncbi:hypothetical protein ACLMJK_003522 [Lecanora helva]